MKNKPLISIVTVTFNAASTVEHTLKSVVANLTDQVEYLMIDGGSTDGTQAVAEKYRDHYAVYLSEPDRGIPDALNKAVKLANGKYLLFILAGDILYELPLDILAQSEADAVCFPTRFTGDGKQYPKVNNWLKIKNTIPHQGAFFKRTPDLIHDEKYRFFCDFDLCQRYYQGGKNIEIHDSPIISFHGLDGATSNKKNFHEVFKIVRANYGVAYQALSYLYWKFDGVRQRLGFGKR